MVSCPFKKETRVIKGCSPKISYIDDQPYDEGGMYWDYGKKYFQCRLISRDMVFVTVDTIGKKQGECVGEDKCPIIKK